jgi:predicted permease
MNWLKRDRTGAEKQLDDELQFHIEQLIDEYTRQGMSTEAAQRRALLEFGGRELAKEECRDLQAWRCVQQFIQDLRYAVRVLLRQPAFTAAVVLTLALGIGANTAIFSVVDALLLRKLPANDPDRLVAAERTFQGDGAAPELFEYGWYEQFRNLTAVFSDVAAIYPVDRSDAPNASSGSEGVDAQVSVRLVTGNYFSVMGVSAFRGRTFSMDDDRDAAAPVAVISHGYWQRRFARVPDITGRTLRLGNATCTIVGVTPPEFTGEWIGKPADIWVPVAATRRVMSELPGLANGRGLQFRMLARLQPGISREQASAAGQVLYQQILNERGGANPSESTRKRIAAARFTLGPGGIGISPQRHVFRQPLAILLGLTGLVLLITCANVSNLLLARAASREHEMALRRAIGAGRGRIVRQLLTESTVLAGMGGALGLLLAYWGTQALAKMAASGLVWQDSQQLILDLRPDARMFAFTAGLSLLVGMLFGLAPALRGAEIGGRASLSSALNHRATALTRRFSLASVLIEVQVAISIVLVMGAGLMVRSLHNLKSQETGLDREHLLLIWTAFRQAGRCRFRQQEVRHVRTRDQEHARCGCQEHE